MHTRRTLALDPQTWDLTLDKAGRVALVREEAATAQNVANEARLFTRDAYFNQERGIPHFVVNLGRRVDTTVLRACLRRAALQVPDVREVTEVRVQGVQAETRKLVAEIRFTTVDGTEVAART